jgi:C1A family cysteine protease
VERGSVETAGGKMKNYSLGWIPDVPDTRDVPFRYAFRLPDSLPASVDLRAGCSPVEDQEELGSCTAQALVGALEFLQIKAGAPVKDLSRLFVYYNERAREGNILSDSGAMLRTGIKVLKHFGVCQESKWPYDISKFKLWPTPDCYEEGRKHQVTAYQRLNTLAEMKACLAMGLPFVFGFSVYASAMSDEAAKTGIIPMPDDNDSLQGGHAVMAVGYDDANQAIIFRNSWGEGWGDMGYGWLPYAFLESRDLSDDFWCIQGTESDLYAMYKIPQMEAVA